MIKHRYTARAFTLIELPVVRKRGFTLIELLVVVTIIAILAVVVFVNLEKAQIKGRDAKRKTDISIISTGLNMYYQQNKIYPQCKGDFSDINTWSGGAVKIDLENGYIAAMPQPPTSTVGYEYRGYVSSGSTGTSCAAAAFYKIIAKSEGIATTDPLAKAKLNAGDYFDVSASESDCGAGYVSGNQIYFQISSNKTAACNYKNGYAVD
jgi:prepilin-type N-terminal cleavage/methylation domain-containing protein